MEKQQKKAEAKEYRKTVAQNRRARHDYFIEDTLEAGIELHGSEVKSLRTQNVSFADCYAKIYDNEAWLIGLQLSTYAKSHVQVPDTVRQRKLLLSRREIDKLNARTERTGMTIVPLELYFRGRWAKVLLGLARGKKEHDKRDSIRKADAKRSIDRVMRDKRSRL